MNLFNLVHIQEKRKGTLFWIVALKNESHRRPEMQGAAFIWLKKNVMVRNSRKLNTVLWFYDTNCAIRPSQNRTAVRSAVVWLSKLDSTRFLLALIEWCRVNKKEVKLEAELAYIIVVIVCSVQISRVFFPQSQAS
jgi:hypothetical protein